MPTTEQHDFPLDHCHRWRDWCAMVGMHPVTAWRLVKAGQGPITTKLSARITGVRHRHHLDWLSAREQHQQDAAASKADALRKALAQLQQARTIAAELMDESEPRGPAE